ncbi:MAG TPA: aldolase/citrate lyase family protein [Selenomonadales bacterium]|nr:aldolase/citrate lyase family protein [Selenomonadales bacterium]
MRDKIARGDTVRGVFVVTGTPANVEILGYAGLDFVILDMEHASTGSGEVEHLIRAAEIGGIAPIVRVSKNDPALILRALDSGACGILVPQVNSATEAEQAVQAARYAPLGGRGLAGIVRAARYGFSPLSDYVSSANRRTLVIVQAEDRRAVENLEAILAVEGVDGVFVGPADLSQSLGRTGQFDHPEVNRIFADVIGKIAGSDKFAGMFCTGADDAKRWQGLGARMLAVGSDTMLLGQAARELVRELDQYAPKEKHNG